MPTYDYSCTACGHRFDRFQSIMAAPEKTCPKCKRKTARRRISAGAGFLFKGSGFYVNDYKKTSAPKADTCPAATDAKPCTECPHAGGNGKSKRSKSSARA